MTAKTPAGFEKTFFEKELKPYLPEKILDFHTHIWEANQWKGYDSTKNADTDSSLALARPEKADNQLYMTTTIRYTMEDLLADGAAAFPGLEYNAVVFGQPTPAIDHKMTNAYTAACAGKSPRLFPLRVTGPALHTSPEELRQDMEANGFYGYKVFLDWVGNEYPPLTFDDMLTGDELRYANDRGLVVLLHVPRGGRLADPEVGESVRRNALKYPNMRLVLAHCGRCYRFEEIREALHWVADLENTWFDCSMVMDPTVMAYILQHKDPRKMLFASDYMVAAMRGKRVNVGDHWVDLVLPGYPEAHYRVVSDNMRATLMIHEIAKAVLIGAELAGLSPDETKRIFYQNGMDLLNGIAL